MNIILIVIRLFIECSTTRSIFAGPFVAVLLVAVHPPVLSIPSFLTVSTEYCSLCDVDRHHDLYYDSAATLLLSNYWLSMNFERTLNHQRPFDFLSSTVVFVAFVTENLNDLYEPFSILAINIIKKN